MPPTSVGPEIVHRADEDTRVCELTLEEEMGVAVLGGPEKKTMSKDDAMLLISQHPTAW